MPAFLRRLLFLAACGQRQGQCRQGKRGDAAPDQIVILHSLPFHSNQAPGCLCAPVARHNA
ncbi:Uncharacterised protein [Bordetella pertussis]|nr:Uncharacterised protein [Bordetella pertussis]